MSSLPGQEDKARDITLLSWNVNGIRAIYKKGFLTWLTDILPDILCLQEIKADISQLSSDLADPSGYYVYWNSAKKPGYSGTALLSREKPISVKFDLGIPKFDQEGRTIIAEYPDFTLLNCYFPNGGEDNSRVSFKLEFYNAFLSKCEELRKTCNALIFCGDVNTSHKEIDLTHPKDNEKRTGFLREERAWIDEVIEKGYIDTFRYFYPNKTEQYTWWSPITKARERNKGWRLDYFFITKKSIALVTEAFIMSEIMGSDHCPVGIRLNIKSDCKEPIKPVKPVRSQLSLF